MLLSINSNRHGQFQCAAHPSTQYYLVARRPTQHEPTSIGKYGDISHLRSRKSWRSDVESWNVHLPLVSGLLHTDRVKVVDDSVCCLMCEPIGAG